MDKKDRDVKFNIRIKSQDYLYTLSHLPTSKHGKRFSWKAYKDFLCKPLSQLCQNFADGSGIQHDSEGPCQETTCRDQIVHITSTISSIYILWLHQNPRNNVFLESVSSIYIYILHHLRPPYIYLEKLVCLGRVINFIFFRRGFWRISVFCMAGLINDAWPC